MSQIFGNVKKKYSKFLNLSKYTYIVYVLFFTFKQSTYYEDD